MLAKIWRLKWVLLAMLLVAGGGWYWWNHVREPDWRAAAIEDVKFIRDTLRADHPGAVNSQDAGFNRTLEEAYRVAAERAGKVDSAAGYFYATRGLTSAFQDAHLATQYTRQIPRTRKDPGFFVGLDEDGIVRVAQSHGENAPPVGARLLSCDGANVETLYATRVEPFTHYSWLSGKRAWNIPWILIDSGNPFVEPLSSCQFQSSDADEPVDYALTWQASDTARRNAFLDTIAPSVAQKTELTFPADGVAWVAIASFFDSGEEVSEELKALISSISKKRDAIEGADMLVIDVRGNQGGASAAGYEVAGALWGQEFVDGRLPHFDSTDWRASDANLERVDDAMLPLRIRFGADSELYRKVEAIRDGVARANRNGDPFFVQPNPVAAPGDAQPAKLPETIYLLTDSSCVSACLDFVDLVLTLPGTVHVGRETAGDTTYLEVVSVDMPSGVGQLVYPTGIHRGRERGRNESHVPSHRFDGDIADEQAILAWLKALGGEGGESADDAQT